jgi:hypothetical protein
MQGDGITKVISQRLREEKITEGPGAPKKRGEEESADPREHAAAS